MYRLLFEKKGNAVWISHLDLMRLFQRAFKRAGLPLTHTQGFNPRPSVSIALPLSVGVESQCELLDFELEGADVSCREIMERLNNALVDGVVVRQVYTDGKKLKLLSFLEASVTLQYDHNAPENALRDISSLFAGGEVVVSKKTKNGPQEQDILPLIKKIDVTQSEKGWIDLRAIVCCQNPSLNPMLLSATVEKYLPNCKPDFCLCSRIEIYDSAMEIFR